jgi:hypothetical protein
MDQTQPNGQAIKHLWKRSTQHGSACKEDHTDVAWGVVGGESSDQDPMAVTHFVASSGGPASDGGLDQPKSCCFSF